MSDILSYPPVNEYKDTPEINDIFVYVIKAYELNGLSVLIENYNSTISWKFGDWDGNQLNINDPMIYEFITKYSNKIELLIKHARINQIQLYLSNMVLVDARTHLNKMLSPGMLNDLFSGIIPTQEVIGKPIIFSGDNANDIIKGSDKYAPDIILKPSKFKTIIRAQTLIPLYALVNHEKKPTDIITT